MLAIAAVCASTVMASAEERQPVLVFAASSLQTTLNKAAAAWERQSGGKVVFSFAGSAALARQIEQSAPADLFVSADLKWMDAVEAKGLLKPGSRKTLFGNSLVLIASADDPVSLSIAPGMPLAQAIGDSRLATGNPDSVPVGRYAKEALTSLGVWESVSTRIAGTDNVRAALALVARGEARFGIVYTTDAEVEPKVKVVGTFPADSHSPILYPFAELAASTNPDAGAFLAFLASPEGAVIFAADGFTLPK